MTLADEPRLSAFNPARVSFGRHETFPLRYAWLPKGFAEMKGNPRCFESDEAPVRLGVGKNMVHAIRYWLRAARMARVFRGRDAGDGAWREAALRRRLGPVPRRRGHAVAHPLAARCEPGGGDRVVVVLSTAFTRSSSRAPRRARRCSRLPGRTSPPSTPPPRRGRMRRWCCVCMRGRGVGAALASKTRWIRRLRISGWSAGSGGRGGIARGHWPAGGTADRYRCLCAGGAFRAHGCGGARCRCAHVRRRRPARAGGGVSL